MPSLKNLIGAVVDLPKDLILNLPRITLVGDLQLVIENHRGIENFDGSYVRIALERGALVINGENLTLRSIHTDEIVVDGYIKALLFEEDANDR
ncbi:MAG: sporulation protein YqfC [Bacillota bacterium]|nr:sporulation protein YqfC [Bacillota bacterium]